MTETVSLIVNAITTQSRDLHEKLIVAQLLKKFPIVFALQKTLRGSRERLVSFSLFI
jgi:hypothetical protein